MEQIKYYIISSATYPEIYGFTVLYFAFLYFVLAPVFLAACRFLAAKGKLSLIVEVPQAKSNRHFEQKNSFASLLMFGFSGIALIYFIRSGIARLSADSFLNVCIGLLILNLWNEVHFFLVHRLLHVPFLYRRVHKVHHQSKVPSVFSVYSFHPLEALLLSTVPLFIAPFISLSALSYLLYPLSSILLNYAGHCNYRFGAGAGSAWKLFGTRHAKHHYKNTGNFGFVTDIMDRILTIKNKK